MGRDARCFLEEAREWVSIHAPRMGRDKIGPVVSKHRARFNSRAPHGARHEETDYVCGYVVSIHAPRMGRDYRPSPKPPLYVVSIHAPRMGRDRTVNVRRDPHRFQFTRPAWGATKIFAPTESECAFQFTRPAWGAT